MPRIVQAGNKIVHFFTILFRPEKLATMTSRFLQEPKID